MKFLLFYCCEMWENQFCIFRLKKSSHFFLQFLSSEVCRTHRLVLPALRQVAFPDVATGAKSADSNRVAHDDHTVSGATHHRVEQLYIVYMNSENMIHLDIGFSSNLIRSITLNFFYNEKFGFSKVQTCEFVSLNFIRFC